MSLFAFYDPEHPPYVTTEPVPGLGTHRRSVMMAWHKIGMEYRTYSTGLYYSADRDDVEQDAHGWARRSGLEYRPCT